MLTFVALSLVGVVAFSAGAALGCRLCRCSDRAATPSEAVTEPIAPPTFVQPEPTPEADAPERLDVGDGMAWVERPTLRASGTTIRDARWTR